MIHILNAIVIISVFSALAGGVFLIVEGLSEKKISFLAGGLLALVAAFACISAVLNTVEMKETHCGVGTEYVPEINGHDWYCKADKDY